MEESKGVRLSKLTDYIQNAFQKVFSSGIWIIAEIADINLNRSGHCYLELVEKNTDNDAILAKVRASIWSYTYSSLAPRFQFETGESLASGMKVFVYGTVEFHSVYGLSINIKNIDPTFTLGDMAQQRMQTIMRLKKEGVFAMNRELKLDDPPQKIAVISSPTAAGWGDFLDQLTENKHQLKFYVKLFPAVMQGPDAPTSIINALEQIFQYESIFDVVVIIRGGGSQVDLNCFNNYDLAYYVTQFPLPILAGVGHDRDESVVDLVANKALKTPTAVAEHLIQELLIVKDDICQLSTRASQLLSYYFDTKKANMVSYGNSLNSLVTRIFDSKKSSLVNYSKSIELLSSQMIKWNGRELKSKSVSMKYMIDKNNQSQVYDLKRQSLLLKQIIRSRLKDDVSGLRSQKETLRNISTRLIQSEKIRIENYSNRNKILDPQNILDRGFSITTLNGKVVRNSLDIKEGDILENILSVGKVESIVKSVKKD